MMSAMRRSTPISVVSDLILATKVSNKTGPVTRKHYQRNVSVFPGASILDRSKLIMGNARRKYWFPATMSNELANSSTPRH